MTGETLTTDRLILRRPVAEDVDGFTEFFTSDRAKYAGGPASVSGAWCEFAQMIGHWTLRGYGNFIITVKDTGEAIGHAGAVHPPAWPEPEIGWSLWRKADESQGFATEAAVAAVKHAYDTLGWSTAVSYMAHKNAASIKLAKRLGAVLDEDAEQPDGLTCLVYRHPSPRGAK